MADEIIPEIRELLRKATKRLYLTVCPILESHVNYYQRKLYEALKHGEQLELL